MTRIKRTPGEPIEPEQEVEPTPEAALEPEPQGRNVVEFKTGDEAAAFFEANPDAPRRAVLTAEGWFVPSEYGTPPAMRGK